MLNHFHFELFTKVTKRIAFTYLIFTDITVYILYLLILLCTLSRNKIYRMQYLVCFPLNEQHLQIIFHGSPKKSG